MASTLIIRNVMVAGRRTSVRLEAAMWDALFEICRREGTTVNALFTHIERNRTESTLTSAVRTYIVAYYRRAAVRAENRHPEQPARKASDGPDGAAARAPASWRVARDERAAVKGA